MVTTRNAERKRSLSIKKKLKSRNIAEDTDRQRREEQLCLIWNPQDLPPTERSLPVLEKGGLAPPPHPLITHPSRTGLNQTRMTGVLQPIPAETPTDPSLIHDQILEGALDQELCQSPHLVLTIDQSLDLVLGQGLKEQHQYPPKNLLS